MAHNGEFLHLSPLQVVQEQPTDSCEAVACGGRRLQLGVASQTWTGCGKAGEAVPLPGLRFPNVSERTVTHSLTGRTAVEANGTPRGQAIRERQNALRMPLSKNTRRLLL